MGNQASCKNPKKISPKVLSINSVDEDEDVQPIRAQKANLSSRDQHNDDGPVRLWENSLVNGPCCLDTTCDVDLHFQHMAERVGWYGVAWNGMIRHAR